MAKFIEIQPPATFCNIDRGHKEVTNVPIYVNIDRIEMVNPYGVGCVIRLIGNSNSIITDHSAVYVMGLINGAR